MTTDGKTLMERKLALLERMADALALFAVACGDMYSEDLGLDRREVGLLQDICADRSDLLDMVSEFKSHVRLKEEFGHGEDMRKEDEQ